MRNRRVTRHAVAAKHRLELIETIRNGTKRMYFIQTGLLMVLWFGGLIGFTEGSSRVAVIMHFESEASR